MCIRDSRQPETRHDLLVLDRRPRAGAQEGGFRQDVVLVHHARREPGAERHSLQGFRRLLVQRLSDLPGIRCRSHQRPDRPEHRSRRSELPGSHRKNRKQRQLHRLVLQLREQCDRQPRSGQSGQTVGLLVGRRHLRHGLRRRRLPRLAGFLGPLPDRSRTALDRIRLGLHQDPQTGRHRRRDGRHHRHVPHGALLRAVPLVGTGPRTTLHPGRRSRNHHRRRPDQDRTDRGSHGQYGQAGDRAVHDTCGQQQSPHNRLRKSHGARDQDHRSHQGDPHRDRRPPVRDQTLPAVDRRHQGNERLTTANNL